MTVVYMDDSPIGDGTKYGKPSLTLNGQAIPLTVTATSGYPQNYVDTYNGSMSTKYESLLTFQVPSNLANGQYTFILTVYDGDGDGDVWAWNVGIGMSGAGGVSSAASTTGSSTALTMADPPALVAGKAAKLTATLTAGGKGLANKNVTFEIRSEADGSTVSCTAKTDAKGVAACSVTPPSAGDVDVDAVFAGDGNYAASADGDDGNVGSAPAAPAPKK
jgi:hypothetical protein